MPDMQEPTPAVPESKVVPRKHLRVSLVWFIPAVAAIIGIWVGITTIRHQGPTITITFKSAEDLEADKTKIRYHGLDVGTIIAIRLSKDHQKVIATAKMNPGTEDFLVQDTAFWVVRPQISGATVSGLSTLISGAYIGMEIGESNVTASSFVALDEPPMETGGVKGRFFTLKTPELDSLNRGTPIYFRRLQAGQVVSYELDKSGKFLNVKIFIQEPYDHFVTTETRFWQASGLNVSLSASGLQVQTESLLSILIGGISFETPEASTESPPAAENTLFTLFKDRDEAFRPPAVNPQTYVVVFKESVRGLAVGAPVEFEGIPIGEVKDFQAQLDARTYQFFVPVTIEVDPARFGLKLVGVPPGQETEGEREQFLNALIAHGLRAQLESGSLITGSRYISLEFVPNAPPVTMDWSQNPPELPAVQGPMESLEDNLSGIAKKLNSMPFKDIGDNLNKTLIDAQGTLTNANVVLMNANRLVSPDSALDAQLAAAINQVGGAAQAISLLADYLERHPESLIRGKSNDSK